MTTDHRPDRLESCPRIVRTRECLLQALDVIDDEGWDGPTGTRLLSFIRADLARPLAMEWGLSGFMAAQAEASAWQAAWRVLTMPQLRIADSPWGVVWQAARRAGRAGKASCSSSQPARARRPACRPPRKGAEQCLLYPAIDPPT